MTDQQLPQPFVPADVDLNGFEFMPLYGERLRTSDHNSGCSDAEFRASINLWWSAWLQVPAASLPNDEVMLCRLADLGRDLKAWKKVRAAAMRNFVLCTDGRYYHSFLAPIALEAWDQRVKARLKGKNGAAKRWGGHQKIAGAVDNHAPATENASPGHRKRMPQPSESDATTKKNDSKRSDSLSRNITSRGESEPGSTAAEGQKSTSKQAAAASAYEIRVVEAGARKGLKASPGESLQAFEARVRTTRA